MMRAWLRQTLTVTRKELRGYFGSPLAFIFIGSFLAVTLFSFFWIETFFARGIADVRPLFSWMPVLMIFLVAALTMRQWSEEQRSGTLEILLTLPVSTVQLVLGKFLAVLALVALALALTIFLPLTVSLLGNLDWGPVFGGYLAAILLAGAYAAIGLFVSSRTDNQIVALISTVLLCGLLYLIGSPGVTNFFGNQPGEILRAIGAGSRFESIERGVVDLRDLAYYLTVAGIFLALNTLSLKAKSWSEGEQTLPKRRGVALTSGLLIVNLLAVNVWMFPLTRLRLDMTESNEYTLSATTRELVSTLQEPLLIRGYFSEKTHPLLAPLVPTVRDMLNEYQVASRGMIQLEIIDPAEEPEKEAEANQVYGIRPTPFQVADRYEASVINSYFDILIQYGDQSEVLGFSDLIEVQQTASGIDVGLRNLEYDLTSNIKKVVFGFQNVDAILASLSEPAQMQVFITPDTLPEWLADAPATIETVLQDIAGRSGGNFTYDLIDPTAPDSPVTPQELFDTYGLQPLAVSLFSDQSYYLYMMLVVGDQAQIVYPQGEVSEAEVRTAVESALKRSSSGFLQVVGLWTPPAEPTQDMFGQMVQPISSWEQVRQTLQQEYEVQTVDLSTGSVPGNIDVLVVIGPQNLDDVARYAIDQHLMRGGAVVVAAGNMMITPDQMSGGLAAQQLENGLQDMLAHYGFTVEQSLVMDPQNEPFPVPVVRQVGEFQVQEIQALDYPMFVDVRPDGMAEDSAITSGLAAVTLNWASPITVDAEKNAEREVETLMTSTPQSWTQTEFNIQPNFELYPDTGFATVSSTQAYTLAVAARGSFASYFAGKPSPLDEAAAAEAMAADDDETEATPVAPTTVGTIEVSPSTSRLVVIGSTEFVDDIVLELSATLSGEKYLNNLQFIQNAVAWTMEDLDLLNIRSRGTAARVLIPMAENEQSFWEAVNYVLALISVVAIAGVSTVRRRNEAPMELVPPEGFAARRAASGSQRRPPADQETEEVNA
ncbi:MAG: Gldg family protein [Anaerolineae bacterium]|nr:Gldg family protein [Anaerolineae bacterium]